MFDLTLAQVSHPIANAISPRSSSAVACSGSSLDPQAGEPPRVTRPGRRPDGCRPRHRPAGR